MSIMKAVSLSAEQDGYISELMSRDKSFRDLIEQHPRIDLQGRIVNLKPEDAEILRDYFTERLARVGFDEDYRPNKEGSMLEQLIDTFCLPGE